MTMADGKAKTSTSFASSFTFHSGESLEPIDLHFGRFIERLGGKAAPSLFLAATLVSRSAREGSICLDLNTVAGRIAPLEMGTSPQQYPDLIAWRMDLLKSSVVGKPGDERPLILDDASRLYLHRYWEYEAELVRFLIQKGQSSTKSFMPNGIDRERLRDVLKRLFPPSDGATGGEGKGRMDWQKVAALATVLQNLTVICGGPGTGKTVTAAKAIILLLEQSPGKKLRIALTAPTGKAAARLQEVMMGTLRRKVSPSGDEWGNDPLFREAIPVRAMTIHRLLGSLPRSSRFRHHRGNLLQVDIVVVDEASMVDLPLLAKLICALPEHARLILLGDRNQLASVEAGAVLSDICGDYPLNHFTKCFADLVNSLTDSDAATPSLSLSTTSPSRIQDCLIELQTNYRFPEESGIHRLSLAINQGAGESALTILKEKRDDCRWMRIPPAGDLPHGLKETIIKCFTEYMDRVYHADHTGEYEVLFDLFDRYRILCALRRGPYGVVEINHLCERILFESGLIRTVGPWYVGRPVMITKNDYGMDLFNGDVGLILPDPERNGEPGAFFRDAGGGLRRFSPVRLPAHETVYALTVHKSQGSEFDNILLIIPDRDAPVLTRELVYTAVTRARKSVTIWGEEALFIRAVSRRSTRSSGLRDALQSDDQPASTMVETDLKSVSTNSPLRSPIHLDN